MLSTKEECAICKGNADYQVLCELFDGTKFSQYFCRQHTPHCNTAANVLHWELWAMYKPLNYSATAPYVRNPLTKTKAGYKVPPQMTTTMRCAMKQLMHKHGFFKAAQILTIGADENERLEILTLAAQMDTEE
jgi:hypothetical protein